MEKSQMTLPMAMGASPSFRHAWDNIDWPKIKREVRRLQVRIAKAIREGHHHKAKALQWLLSHSTAARFLAVKLVTSNKGKRTPGVDGVIWNTPKRKWQAVSSLRRKDYRAKPLRRHHIPKKNGQSRPLGIPTMKDRGMQALYLLGLIPIAEVTADSHSYGFRPHRSTADAIEQCFNVFAQRNSAQWVLEGDIKACFDRIDHQWVRNHIPMDKTILDQWLRAGFCEQGQWFPTEAGTPQGGIASPTIANMVLDGLEAAVAQAVPRRRKVNVVRYADDFIVSADDKSLLEQTVKPAIEKFLQHRGLELSPEKTCISHIDDGFDFLGFNVRKYEGKLLIKPAKKNVKNFLDKTREFIKSHPSIKTAELIRILNPKIRGWAYYYRHVVAYKALQYVDRQIGHAVWRWIHRRHPNKSARWKQHRYYCQIGNNNWRFCAHHRQTEYRSMLYQAASVGIRRHTKICAQANPFDPAYQEYFKQRARHR
jgi:RNA-directed DNA polymerase